MEVAAPQRIDLEAFMPEKEAIWGQIVQRHGLRPTPYAEIAAWPFGDFVFQSDWDVIMDDGKRIRAGFTKVVDTEERVLAILSEFQSQRLIP